MKISIPWVKGAFFALLCIGASTSQAQVELRVLTEESSRFNDVNDSGQGVTPEMYYDFDSNTLTPMEAEATGLTAISNDGNVAGSMNFDLSTDTMQPGYREDGIWYPIGWFPDSTPSESTFVTHGMSPSGKYVVGQMSIGITNYGTFLYDTEEEQMYAIFDPQGRSIAGLTVTDAGLIGGWVNQPNDFGTLRIPAFFDRMGNITLIPEGQLPTATTNSVSDINPSGIMVGDFDGQPYIYDSNTETFTIYETPDGGPGVFTSISDDGVVVGYEEINFEQREAIIYHPNLGDEPLYLKDVLANFGITVSTIDGKLGTAYSISSNGNFVGGWVNGTPSFAEGWIINFDGLLFQDTGCNINCPENIEVAAEEGETTKVVDYEISFECDDEIPAGTELVLVDGLESGSAFPIGNTRIYYRLEDGEGNILDYCSFTVQVNDSYCTPEFEEAVEPITYVNFAGIDNTTSDLPSAPQNEYFLDIVGDVEQGQTYAMTLKGTTNGQFTNVFTVFIDWNQDGEFNTTDEMYDAGSVSNSNGMDDKEALSDIAVPEDATLGVTRMRIVKNYNEAATDPCGDYYYGQSEDYTLNVGTLGNTDLNLSQVSIYPNPMDNVVFISSKDPIDSAAIYTVTGQKISGVSFNKTNTEINVSSLSTGIYFLKISSNGNVKTLKVIKK